MLRSLKELERYAVYATDCKVGRCVDFLLGSPGWLVSHLVVKTEGVLGNHQVLIARDSVVDVDQAEERFHLALTADQVDRSPQLGAQRSAMSSRAQFASSERPYETNDSELEAQASCSRSPLTSSDRLDDSQIPSARALRGCAVRASDGCIGQVDDLIVQDDIWEVRYLVLDTSKWWVGKKVLIAPQWATGVSWTERTLHVNMSIHAIRTSPEWDPSISLERDYEARLFRHYGFPGYWGDRELKSLSRASAHDEAMLIERQRHQHD